MIETDNQVALPSGSRILFYELIDKLGQGAFGMTYLALDTQRNRPVVLKEYFPSNAAVRSSGHVQVSLLSTNKQSDFDEGLRRFRREAQVLSEFDHPNVVKVVGLFDANDTAYFVMEHIDGQSLEGLIESRGHRAFSEDDIKKNFMPVLNGLEAVHQTKLLHLDIKPDNILTSKYGQPLLIDFGGARYATSKASQDHSSMVATHGYAPPEQYSLKQQQTAATDIYAVGITLYHLMAPGVEIPDSKDRQTAFQDELPDPLPPIRQVAKGYSEVLYQAVEACTQLSKVKRPQSIAEVKSLLGAWADTNASTTIGSTSGSESGRATTPAAQAATTPAQPELKTTPAEPSSGQQSGGNSGTPEPTSSGGANWGVIIAILLLLGGGGFYGFQQYQIQQEEARLAELRREEAARQAKLEAERKEREQLAAQAKQKIKDEALAVYEQAKAEAEKGNVGKIAALRKKSNQIDPGATTSAQWDAVLKRAKQQAAPNCLSGNCYDGYGTIKYAGGTYKGTFRKAKPHGTGKLDWPKGDKYSGDFKDGARTGDGTYTWPNGGKYVGDWLNSDMHGKGTYTWSNGNKYTGDWKKGERTGRGTMRWSSGSKYVGDFIKGVRTGKGTYTWKSGDKYVGDWKDNQQHGKGTYTWADGSIYKGQYANNKRSGQGSYTWTTGNTYVGEWSNNNMTGNGYCVKTSGKREPGKC